MSWRQMKLAGLGLVCLASMTGCISNTLLGVDVCGKECSTASDCGSGFTCEGGVCAGDPCGAPNNTGNGSSGSATATSSATGPSSAASGASSLTASSRASSAGGTSHATSSTVASSSRGATSSAATSGAASASSRPASGTSAATSGAPSSSSLVSPSSSVTGPCAGRNPGDSCGTNRFCDATLTCITGCVIAGQVVAEGAADPNNACRTCQPSRSTTSYRGLADGTQCSPSDPCLTGVCVNSQCNTTPTCTDPTPQCNGGACSCTSSPFDTCLNSPSNKLCLANGTCGCNDNNDCGFAEQCDLATNTCAACDTVGACGIDCQPCRSAVAMTPNRGHYLTCGGNNQPAAFACTVSTCAFGTANCNQDDSDQCEVNTATDAANCGVCEVACDSGTCTFGRCGCPQGSNQCPTFNGNQQGCSNSTCRCADNSECPTGTTCDLNNNRRVCRYPG